MTVKAIQISDKRTGSTLLQRALNLHPDIRGLDELFVMPGEVKNIKKSGYVPYMFRKPDMRPENYIKNIIWADEPDKSVVFKLMYNQIENGRVEPIIKFIQKEKVPVIHLIRKNLVKKTISGLSREERTPDRLFDEVVRGKRNIRKYKHLFQKLPNYLELYYEDIVGEKVDEKTYLETETNRKLCEFFGVNNIPLYVKSKKKKKEDIWLYLPDRAGVEKRFKGEVFEWMIKE